MELQLRVDTCSFSERVAEERKSKSWKRERVEPVVKVCVRACGLDIRSCFLIGSLLFAAGGNELVRAAGGFR